MTAQVHERVSQRFEELLVRCMQNAGEDVLEQAYELGRTAWANGMGVVQLTLVHYEALANVVRGLSTPQEVARATKSASRVAAESLSVFEVAMRGFQEANTILMEANRKLEAANRELDAFSYSVSHDLRTPLRAIDGFSRQVYERYHDQLDEQARHYLTRVRAGVQHMSDLIDALLNLSRIGRTPVREEPTDLSALARDVAAGLERREPERTVSVDIEPGMQVRADSRLLRIVLENLLGNAWKFTSKRKDARIEMDRTIEDGRTVYHVRDNGAGFDMALANKLFVPFQRLHMASEYEGTGVGLATVQRIVSRLGGRIWAEGKVGEGAVFSFTLG